MMRYSLLVGLLMLYLQTQHIQGLLVNQTKEEFEKNIMCIATAKSQEHCDEFKVCIEREPKRATIEFHKCYAELNPKGEWKCDETHDLYTPKMLSDIVDCVDEHTPKYDETQEKEMVDFEKCTKDLVDKVCPVKVEQAHSERSTWRAAQRVEQPAVFKPMISPLSNSPNWEKSLLTHLPGILHLKQSS